jgi:hypothetical protein
LALTHIVFETTAVINTLGSFVYWAVIHHTYTIEGWGKVHMYLVHILPTVCLFIVYVTTDRLLVKASHWKMTTTLAAIYGPVNYWKTKTSGEPLYWFITWEDWKTPAIIAVIMTAVVLLWVGMARATEWGKNK